MLGWAPGCGRRFAAIRLRRQSCCDGWQFAFGEPAYVVAFNAAVDIGCVRYACPARGQRARARWPALDHQLCTSHACCDTSWLVERDVILVCCSPCPFFAPRASRAPLASPSSPSAAVTLMHRAPRLGRLPPSWRVGPVPQRRPPPVPVPTCKHRQRALRLSLR